MTSHPNRSNYRYFKVCPRGFVNEVIYFRVPSAQIGEVDAYFADYEDRQFNAGATSASCGWTTDAKARQIGVAVDWDDRAYVGI